MVVGRAVRHSGALQQALGVVELASIDEHVEHVAEHRRRQREPSLGERQLGAAAGVGLGVGQRALPGQ